jgi:hypothetical protein
VKFYSEKKKMVCVFHLYFPLIPAARVRNGCLETDKMVQDVLGVRCGLPTVYGVTPMVCVDNDNNYYDFRTNRQLKSNWAWL